MCGECQFFGKKCKTKKCSSILSCVVHCENCPKGEILTECSETEFNVIQQALHVRQHRASAVHRLDEVRSCVPAQFDVSVHGHHHGCYKKFTNTLNFCSAEVFLGEMTELCMCRHLSMNPAIVQLCLLLQQAARFFHWINAYSATIVVKCTVE